MNVLLTGGTGYIGSRLVRALIDDGHRCAVVSRRAADRWRDERVRLIRADPSRPGAWQDEVNGVEAVVNLAGARLVEPPHRWSAARKRSIKESRVATTEHLADAIHRADHPPAVLISGSAVGYYGDRGEDALDERSAPGSDFLAEVCVAWEAAADVDDRTRLVQLRSGLVLGPESPVLAPMVRAFKLGVGGPWGSGAQWWPWVHVDDVIAVVLLALDGRLDGPVNVTSPNPVRVAEFAKALGRALHRPAVARVPALVLRIALGEAADALLASQRVVPAKLLGAGFSFRHPHLDGALRSALA